MRFLIAAAIVALSATCARASWLIDPPEVHQAARAGHWRIASASARPRHQYRAAAERRAPRRATASSKAIQEDSPVATADAFGFVAEFLTKLLTAPQQIAGLIEVGGERFRFRSGGYRGAWSIPYGDFKVTPRAVGSWGASHGAIGVADNEIYDRRLRRYRRGIEMHAGSYPTLGCLVVDRWAKFRAAVFALLRGGDAWLHVGPWGASVTRRPHEVALVEPPSIRRSKSAVVADSE